MAYYKYIHIDRFDSLRKGRIRFTQPGAFNDPFEMPTFKAEEAARTRSAGLANSNDIMARLTAQTEDIMAGLTAGRIPEAAFTLPVDYWRRPEPDPASPAESMVPSKGAIEKIGAIDKSFGILALSMTPDNLLLWAHYADDHRGLAVEIDPGDPQFDRHAGDARNFERAHPVTYSAERPLIPETDEILFDNFFVKSPEWSYEQEYRIVRKFESAVETIGTPPFAIHLYELPPTAVRKVIFGARVTVPQRQTLMSETRADPAFAHVHFAQAAPDPAQFKLNIVDIPPA
jgi:hypothetical protein